MLLNAFDYLIKLLERREERSEKYFTLYVEPAYAAAEEVFNDLVQTLYTLRRRFEEGIGREEAIRHLEDGRLDYLAVRLRLRALLARRSRTEQLSLFEHGILGVLCGGLARFEDAPRDPNPYNPVGHTLLDVLYALSDKPMEQSRTAHIRIVDEQLRAIHSAWEDVVDGYAELTMRRIT